MGVEGWGRKWPLMWAYMKRELQVRILSDQGDSINLKGKRVYQRWVQRVPSTTMVDDIQMQSSTNCCAKFVLEICIMDGTPQTQWNV